MEKKSFFAAVAAVVVIAIAFIAPKAVNAMSGGEGSFLSYIHQELFFNDIWVDIIIAIMAMAIIFLAIYSVVLCLKYRVISVFMIISFLSMIEVGSIIDDYGYYRRANYKEMPQEIVQEVVQEVVQESVKEDTTEIHKVLILDEDTVVTAPAVFDISTGKWMISYMRLLRKNGGTEVYESTIIFADSLTSLVRVKEGKLPLFTGVGTWFVPANVKI